MTAGVVFNNNLLESLTIQPSLVERFRTFAMQENRKKEWRRFEEVLKKHRVEHLYHFTDIRNLDSIREHGGQSGQALPCLRKPRNHAPPTSFGLLGSLADGQVVRSVRMVWWQGFEALLRRPAGSQEPARAVEELMQMVSANEAELVSSFVVEAEHSSFTFSVRREEVRRLINLAQGYAGSDPTVLERAKDLEKTGFGTNDALHLSAAEHAGVDYFITCDDKLLKRARRTILSFEVVTPPELLEREVR